MSKIHDSTGGGNKPVNDPVAYAPTLDIFNPQGFGNDQGQCVDTSASDGDVGLKPFDRAYNDHYQKGLTGVMDMYDNLRNCFNADEVTFMNIDRTLEGTIELTSTKEVRNGTIKVISVNGTALGFSEITPIGDNARFIAIHWGPDAQVYHPIEKPGTYPLPLSDGGQLVVDWPLDDSGKPASEVKVTYRPAHLAQWPEPRQVSMVDGKAIVYGPEGKQCVPPGKRIKLPKVAIAETTVSVYGEEWMIVSKDGKVAFEKESGLPKIYFDSHKDSGERMSIKPRPANPFIVTPEGKLYLAEDVLDKILWEERLRCEAKPVPADKGMPRLTNPDSFIEAPKADFDPFSKGKKGGGPFKFAQDVHEFVKYKANSSGGGGNTPITPPLGVEDLDAKLQEAMKEPHQVADAEPPKQGGAEPLPVYERSPVSRGPAALLKNLIEFHGRGKVGYLNLVDSPAEIHLTSSAEYPVGSGNVVMIGDSAYGISEVTRGGQRVIDLYTASSPNKPISIDKPGEHIYTSHDGGLLRLDWTEHAGVEGKTYGRVDASYIPRDGVQAFLKGRAAEGKGFYKVGASLHSIGEGEKVQIPAKGLSEVYVVYDEKSWKINGLDGKVDVSPFESSKGMRQVYYDISYSDRSFGTPRTDHPFHITPEGDAYLVYDKAAAVENHVAVDPKAIVENAKGPLHMGELMSNGTFNVLGGAIVVLGAEAISAFYEEAIGEPLPEGAEGIVHPVVGIGTFYGLSLWMESAVTPGAMDLIAFNANFARATPGALAVGAPIFYGTNQLVSETGIDPMSFEGQLATTTIGGAGLAFALNATLPGFLTVGGYTTGASLMSATAIGELGVLGTSTILLGEGILVAGAGAAGYGVGTYIVDPVGGKIAYAISEETAYSDGTLSGWLAEDWRRPVAMAFVYFGPVGALAVYGAKELGDYVAHNPEKLEATEYSDSDPKPDAFDHSEGPFTSIW